MVTKLQKSNSRHFVPLSQVPEILAEFNREKNFDNPDTINANSGAVKKYWWTCQKSHDWEANMRDRYQRNNKCPYCSGRYATSENNLQTLHPTIAMMLDEEKNGIPASDVTPNQDKKLWWKCSKGHEFLKSPRETVRTDGFCFKCNSLEFKFPELKDYYHPENTVAFENLSYGSNKKVKWLCDADHEYDQTVSHKTGHGLGCPFCSGRYATKENNLLLVYPEIAKEFDVDKSETTPDQVTPKSNRNMWWKCPKGHSYKTTPGKKTREDLPYGCPFCSGYQIDETNSFGHLFPELAKEFLADVNGVDPYKVPTGRSKRYSWKCSKSGHIFKGSIADRTRRGDGCPYCYGRYATPQNNLAVIKPEDAKHFHPTKNGKLTPFDVTPSSNQKIHWTCEKGHEWITTPGAKKGCSQCSLSATSKVERLLRQALVSSSIMDELKPEGTKLKLKWRKNSSLTVDILATLGSERYAIEYDGYYFHSGIHSGDKADAYLKDAQKTQALLDAGYHVVRIREDNVNGKLDFLPLSHTNLLQLHFAYNNKLKVKDFSEAIKQIDTWIKTR